ncbi:MAG TPA: amino acid permease [Cytophagaceae bacterium]|nr:amino acid permease [Cytophagaceae bacterium]
MNFEKLFLKKDPNKIERDDQNTLVKNLTFFDLTSMGIAAIIGAGIFGTIGKACFDGGPAVSVLFLFTAVACLCSALCYAHFASSIKSSGSAYTYAYVAFGEIIAWIIGWDLLMEYAIGNIAVAISWSDYFTTLLRNLSIPFPEYLSVDYLSAQKFYNDYISSSNNLASYTTKEGYIAWSGAPTIGGFKIIFDVPALCINILITWLVFIGIKSSKKAGNMLVFIKLFAVLLVIAAGAFYINSDHWHPFAPNGISGIFKGTAGVFFAYIGFDAISTTAEECKNPQKDLPRAMIWSLVICTILYILIALVLTGMVSYQELNVGDPLAYVFELYHLTFLSDIIAISAVAAMASVMLVFQLGQPRILLNMSRDGLLPSVFSKIHPTFRTPSFATIVTGLMVAVPILFLNHTTVTDLCAIGTLFAFALVCAGALMYKNKSDGFKIPYYNSKYLVPSGFFFILILLYLFNRANFLTFFTSFHIENTTRWIFILYAFVISWYCIRKNLSFIPVAGLSCNLYLITELGLTNWIRFGIWLIIGLIIYFLYGYKKSLNNSNFIKID